MNYDEIKNIASMELYRVLKSCDILTGKFKFSNGKIVEFDGLVNINSNVFFVSTYGGNELIKTFVTSAATCSSAPMIKSSKIDEIKKAQTGYLVHGPFDVGWYVI